MKVLVFDSGPLINLSMNGLLYLLEDFKKEFPEIKFIITNQVKYEVLDRPIKVQRFELGALRIQRLLNNKTLELPESLNISSKEIDKRTKPLLDEANKLINLKYHPIEIVSEGEISCLALSQILTEKDIENIIGIDERTTRTLAEDPKNLEDVISRKLHKKVKLANKDFNPFKQFKFIRSTELVYVAVKKGIAKIKDPKALEAMIYATKFKGASISWDEIKTLKKL
jgi:hypothetical protein